MCLSLLYIFLVENDDEWMLTSHASEKSIRNNEDVDKITTNNMNLVLVLLQ